MPRFPFIYHDRWDAGPPHVSYSEWRAMRAQGVKPSNTTELELAPWPLAEAYEAGAAAALPEQFDPRERWPWCSTLFQIRDQGNCGSCWATAVTEALSDRFCTLANITVDLSPNDVTACCTACGAGCGGGDPAAAGKYLNTTGAVSAACSPYDQGDLHCAWHKPAPGPPTCHSGTCLDGETWAASKRHGTVPYNVPRTMDAIKLELFTNGPAGTQMTVYDDFAAYKGGIYQTNCTPSTCTPWGHAIKIFGYGTDTLANGTTVPYWRVANSWCRQWGEAGFFRIIAGVNEVGIEGAIQTQLPIV